MEKAGDTTTELQDIQESSNEIIQDDEDITDSQNTYEPITYLETCSNCGNMWDGYAQCYCHGLRCYRKDYTSDTSDEEQQDLDNPESKNSAETRELEGLKPS
jgi:hypothetical protein